MHLAATESPTDNEPHRPLGKHGRRLWDRCLAQYDISDEAGLEMLLQAAEALDRLQELRTQIHTGRASKKNINPFLKVEIATRRFVTHTLQRLGLNLEPLQARPGRPHTPLTWIRPEDAK